MTFEGFLISYARKGKIMGRKQQQVQQYIKALPLGEAISVRTLAEQLDVSDGTAYRAIKQAEEEGYVATIPRVGTVRISNEIKEESVLTFEDIIPMIDGVVYSGRDGLSQPLKQFMIGAMKEEEAIEYMRPHALLIVGNRENIQEEALRQGMAILVTGGFSPTQRIIAMSNEKALPVIGTDYDSFTVATMINKALGEQLIKKDIVQIRDVKLPFSKTVYLHQDDPVVAYFRCIQHLNHDVVPIVDKQQRLTGIVTHREVQGKDLNLPLEKVMRHKVVSVNNNTNVATVAHLMIWDNYDYLPVVKENGILDGMVSRSDIMMAMQEGTRVTSNMRTFSEEIGQSLIEKTPKTMKLPAESVYVVRVTPQMIHRDGTLSFGVMSELLMGVTRRFLDGKNRYYRLMIDQLTIDFMELAQLDNKLTFYPRLLDERRLSAKIDIEIYNEKQQLVAKAKIVCHSLQEPEA